MPPAYVLVHSPLVGPVTWSLVARVLRERGLQAHTPTIRSDTPTPPYWKQHARDVANGIASVPAETPLILVGHSGAGQLLPGIRELLLNEVLGYVFVDAGLPENGSSRLDSMRRESADFARQFRAELECGTRFPTWTDADLRPVIPDDTLRAEVVNDLRPQPLAFFTEPILVFAGWPDAPCAYIQFTSGYEVFAEDARSAGWPFMRLEGDHFHMLVDPGAVADAILAVTAPSDTAGSL